MQMFGPFTLTSGTIQQVNIPQSTETVRIQHNSNYNLFASFAASQPNAGITVSGGDWQECIQPGHVGVLAIPGSAKAETPLGDNSFNGSVWLLPLSVPGQALNGTINSTSQAWVTVFGPGEMPTQAYADPVTVQPGSQQRVLTIPMVPTTCFALDTGAVAQGAVYTPFPAIIAQPGNAPTWDGNTFVVVYLYYGHFSASATSTTWAQWILQVQEMDVNHNPIAGKSHNILWFQIWHDETNARSVVCNFYPAFPAKFQIRPVNTCGSLQVQLMQNGSNAGATAGVHANFGIDVDLVNGNNPPSIGGGSSGSITPKVYQPGGNGIY